MAAWREWLLGNRGRQGRRAVAIARSIDMWERAGQTAPAILPAVAEVEATALQVYAAHGLPTRTGHYQRAPGALEWVWLAEDLPAEQRWAMVLEYPLEHGWRYAILEDIGRFPGAPPELTAASRLLAGCRHLKQRLAGKEPGDPGEDLQHAIRLGADWQVLKDAMAWKESVRLKLTVPSDALPAQAPDKPKRTPKTSASDKPKAPPKPRAPRKPKAR